MPKPADYYSFIPYRYLANAFDIIESEWRRQHSQGKTPSWRTPRAVIREQLLPAVVHAVITAGTEKCMPTSRSAATSSQPAPSITVELSPSRMASRTALIDFAKKHKLDSEKGEVSKEMVHLLEVQCLASLGIPIHDPNLGRSVPSEILAFVPDAKYTPCPATGQDWFKIPTALERETWADQKRRVHAHLEESWSATT